MSISPHQLDARAVTQTRPLFVNGLDFECWINHLVEASDFEGTRLVTTPGIKPLSN